MNIFVWYFTRFLFCAVNNFSNSLNSFYLKFFQKINISPL